MIRCRQYVLPSLVSPIQERIQCKHSISQISGYVVYDSEGDCTERHDVIEGAIRRFHETELMNFIFTSIDFLSVLDPIRQACDDEQTPDDGCYVLELTTCDDITGEFFLSIKDVGTMRFNFTVEIR